jgi:2-polyprenyl-3-methyl-5-hydroxy-6-metoxy-1,4-benzoquinol methylase
MDVKTHWEKVYKTKAPDTVSWYLPHLETSLALIERTGASLSSSIIDVGGGESTLAYDLVSRGYQNVTVLDISETAVNVSKQRMGEAATTSNGSLPMSSLPNSSILHTMFGMTAPYSIF